MNKLLALAFCLAAMLNAVSQSALPDWENPEVTGINKEKPHSTWCPYPDEQYAAKADIGQSPWIMKLNGHWKFNFADNPTMAPNRFYETDFPDADWKTNGKDIVIEERMVTSADTLSLALAPGGGQAIRLVRMR